MKLSLILFFGLLATFAACTKPADNPPAAAAAAETVQLPPVAPAANVEGDEPPIVNTSQGPVSIQFPPNSPAATPEPVTSTFSGTSN